MSGCGEVLRGRDALGGLIEVGERELSREFPCRQRLKEVRAAAQRRLTEVFQIFQRVHGDHVLEQSSSPGIAVQF